MADELENKHLICCQCGEMEGVPFDVGDYCLCGGYFVEADNDIEPEQEDNP